MSLVTQEEKDLTIGQLMKARETANTLRFSLRLKGREEDAALLASKSEELTRVIDQLFKKAFGDWLDAAAGLQAQFEQANKSLEKSIQDMEKSVETAQKITTVIGFIDDAIGLGRRALSPV